ncbi:iron-siderophore ABC transporter substrate-binding protein [Streptacidiphilus pinicola]|uniref:Iron-siderophore ABC transporter substrate-binding protein n=1 Tax=Streptacidiphilus pinicola TaxID=2219663 RepID=A0A2X0IP18_9ACTN|nr:ABC transporter substrate-binding protein [Streptacidiphilus pinicola]RAG86944.1 iron-siderophore ABC transporter substrate-binding protein [Streptacidiphilus pinicola]
MPGAYSRRALLGALGALGASVALNACKGVDHLPPDSGAATGPGAGTGGALAGPGVVAAGASSSGSGAASASASPTPLRTVQAATGSVQVPPSPSRVVVLGTAELDSALTLGATPVGAARAALDGGLPDYFPSGWLSPVAEVGAVGGPDLGEILQLQPDLILSSRAVDGSRYHQLAAIAPTVLTESTGASWKQDFQLHTQALNAQTFADAITSAYQDHVREVTAALGGTGATRKQQISLVRFVQDQEPRLVATRSFLGVLLADVQLGRPSAQNAQTAEVVISSTDKLGEADGTTIFYATYGDPARAHTDEVLNSQAWKDLSAVKAGRAYAVDDQLWYQGIGYFGADLILAQLRRYLGG